MHCVASGRILCRSPVLVRQPRHALAGCRIPHFHNPDFFSPPVHRPRFYSLPFTGRTSTVFPITGRAFTACTFTNRTSTVFPFTNRLLQSSRSQAGPSPSGLSPSARSQTELLRLSSLTGLPGLDSSGWNSWVGLLGLGCLGWAARLESFVHQKSFFQAPVVDFSPARPTVVGRDLDFLILYLHW